MHYNGLIKKFKGLIPVLSAIICLTACSTNSYEQTDWELEFTGYYTYSDYGICYNYNGNAHLCDAETGEEIVICSQPDCRHGRNKACDGYIGAMSTDLFLTDKYEIFIRLPAMEGDTTKGFNDVELWRADLDGRNRRLLTELENTQLTIGAAYTDGLFVYCYREQDKDTLSEGSVSFEHLSELRAGIYLIDVNTGAAELIEHIEGYEAAAAIPLLINEKLYYMTTIEDAERDYERTPGFDWSLEEAFRSEHLYNTIYSYDLRTGEKKEVFAGKGQDVFCFGKGYIIYPSNECSDYRLMTDGDIISVKNAEFDNIVRSEQLTGVYIYNDCVYLIYDEKIVFLDIKTMELESFAGGVADNQGLHRIEAITGSKVYYTVHEDGCSCTYVADKEEFLRGDLSNSILLMCLNKTEG